MNRYQRETNRNQEAKRKVQRGLLIGWFLWAAFGCCLLSLAILLSQ